MPRRHRSARDRPPPPLPKGPSSLPPVGTQAQGYTVRQVSADKEYLCPGCNGTIASGVAHVVVFEEEQPDLRRHWHTPCWRQEVRRFG